MSEYQSNLLRKCHACNGIVSKKAKSCPHCGERRPYRDPRHVSPIVSYSLIGLMFAYGIYAFSKGPNKNSATTFQISESDRQQIWILESQDGVRERLKDPDSAVFKDVFFSSASGTPVACGHVNSKNTMGGYSGFQRFIASGEALVYFEEQVSDFDKVWQKMCKQ